MGSNSNVFSKCLPKYYYINVIVVFETWPTNAEAELIHPSWGSSTHSVLKLMGSKLNTYTALNHGTSETERYLARLVPPGAVLKLLSNSSDLGYVHVALPHNDVISLSRRQREKKHIIACYLVGSSICSRTTQN